MHIYRTALIICSLLLCLPCISANAQTYIDMAEKYKKQGNFYKSNLYYMHAIKQNVDLRQAYMGLAHNYYASREYDTALLYLGKLLEEDPNHQAAQLLKAQLLVITGNKKELNNILGRLEQLPQQEQKVLYIMASVYSALDNQEKANEYRRLATEMARLQEK